MPATRPTRGDYTRSVTVTLAAMLHQAFLLGSIYELDMFGNITKRLFENLNTRFHNSSSLSKFVTMIYGDGPRG